MAAKLCPKCLSGIEPAAKQCSQCGARLVKANFAKSTLGAVAAGFAVVVAAALWWTSRPRAPQPERPETASRPQPAEDVVPQREPTPWVWCKGAASAPAFPALALQRLPTSATALLVPLALVPLDGPLLNAAGSTLPLQVLSYDINEGYLLAVPTSPLEGNVRPAAVVAVPVTAGTWLVVTQPTVAGTDALQVQRATTTRLELERDLPLGAVLSVDGAVAGYALGGRNALALSAAHSCPQDARLRSLVEVQAELKEWLPQHLHLEVAQILALPEPTSDQLHRAMELVHRIETRANDPQALRLVDQRRRMLWQRLVRTLTRDEPNAALDQARLAVARYPDDSEFLADALLLAARTGASGEAVSWFQQLQLVSDKLAKAQQDRLTNELTKTAQDRLRRGRAMDAVVILADALSVFPDRADLHLGYARALLGTGQTQAAQTEAQIAVRLDPSLAKDLADLMPVSLDVAGPNEVVIPLRPGSNALAAEVAVAGTKVEFLVDTGASYTTIPSAVARSLGLLEDKAPTIHIQTASGTLEASLVTVPWIQLGPIRVARVRAAVVDLPGDLGGKGLLGLNFLRHLDMHLDGTREVLVLRPRGKRSK